MAKKSTPAASLSNRFAKEILPNLQKNLGLSNYFAVPRVEKVVVNVGVGKHVKDSKFIDSVVADLTKITGQRPVRTKARKAIAGFKIREGNIVGVKATLRGKRMYDFLDKLVNAALPRVRDFRGISATSFDPMGNYNLGIREHLVFPEISSDAVENTFPLEVTVVTSASNPSQAHQLLKALGFPFKSESK